MAQTPRADRSKAAGLSYSLTSTFRAFPRQSSSPELPSQRRNPPQHTHQQVGRHDESGELFGDSLPPIRSHHVSASRSPETRSALIKLSHEHRTLLEGLRYAVVQLRKCQHPLLDRLDHKLETEIRTKVTPIILIANGDGPQQTQLLHKSSVLIHAAQKSLIKNIKDLQKRYAKRRNFSLSVEDSVEEHDTELVGRILRVLQRLWTPREAATSVSGASRPPERVHDHEASRMNGSGARASRNPIGHARPVGMTHQLDLNSMHNDTVQTPVGTEPSRYKRKTEPRLDNLVPSVFKRKHEQYSAGLATSQLQSSQPRPRKRFHWDKPTRTDEHLPSPAATKSRDAQILPRSPSAGYDEIDAGTALSPASEDHDEKDTYDKHVVAAAVLRAMGLHPNQVPLNHAIGHVLWSQSVPAEGHGRRCLAVLQDSMVSEAREYWATY